MTTKKRTTTAAAPAAPIAVAPPAEQKPVELQRKDWPRPATVTRRQAAEKQHETIQRALPALKALGIELPILADISAHELEDLSTLRLILNTQCDCTTPAENLIVSLIHSYAWSEDDHRGLTVQDVESELDEMRLNLRDAIRDAYHIADRYPRSETPTTKASEAAA
jgi:hypothetical protein